MTKVFKKVWAVILTIICCLANFMPPELVGALVNADNTESNITDCYDVTFIFARGSGEVLDGPSYDAWKTANQEALSRLNLDISYNFYELGSAPQFGAQYPAVAVSGNIEAIGNMLGAFVSGGASFNFGASVEEGSRELLNYIGKVSIACPDTKFVLGGYSQGAMLTSRVLDQINSDKVIYVATFGDPKLYLPEGKGTRPVACSGKELSNYRAYVSDCHAYEGVLGSYRPYQPTGYYNKLGTYCNGQDIMCSSGMSISDHTAYTTRGIYQAAARTIANRIRSAFRPENDATDEQVSVHDLLLVFDATFGMRSGIDNYIAEAKALVRRTRSLGGRVAIYTFSQRGAQSTYLRPIISEVCDFTCTPEKVDSVIESMNDRLSIASSLGGLPLYMTLNKAMNKLQWQVGATKTAVVFTSELPRGTDFDGSTAESIAELSLSIDPVNVFALVGNEVVAQQLETLTSLTNGKTYVISDQPSQLIEDVTGRPLAQLTLETYSGIVGDEFVFDASGDDSEQALADLRFDWDLDADGVFEIQNSTAVIRHAYSVPTSGYIQVKVTDVSGYSSTMSAKLSVTAKTEKLTQVSSLQAKRTGEQEFQISFETNAPRVLVLLNDAILGFIDSSAQRTFTVTDISQDSELKLVPYSASGVRGESASIALEITAEISQPPFPDSSALESNTTGSSDSIEDLISSLPQPPIKTRPVFIPKAPDTGYFAARCELR